MDQTSDSPERRRFTRIPFSTRVIFSNGSGIWHGELLDISLHGLLMSRPDNWDEGAGGACRITVALERGGPEINVEGRLVHAGERFFGLRFEQMDLPSATHLRRLIALNLGDEQLLERELAELIKAHGGT